MLWSIVRIAFRNVTRNTKRSLITMAAIIIGCACIVFARGFINGLHKGMIDGVTQTITGDVQIHHRDYLKSTDALPLNLAMKVDEALEEVLKSDPRIDAWSGRLRFTGMISNGLTTSLFIGNALDPVAEFKVTPDLQQEMAQGEEIRADRLDGVVIADRLARAMKISVGDSLTLTASTKDGALNSADVVVVGIRKTGTSMTGTEGKIIDMPITAAQDLLYMPDEVSELVINLKNFDDIESVVVDLQKALDARLADRTLAVNSWEDVSRLFVDILDTQDLVLWIVVLVLFLVMITGIVNTMLMAVMERIREIGTMMAMGVRRTRIVSMFIMEGVALGTIGSLAGVIIGFILVAIFQEIGVEFHPATYNRPVYVRPFIYPEYLLLVVGIAVVSALLSAIYPSFRASRLEPAEALRSV